MRSRTTPSLAAPLGVLLAGLLALGACGSDTADDGTDRPSATASAPSSTASAPTSTPPLDPGRPTSPEESTHLPTQAPPSGPPSEPTDTFTTVEVGGSITRSDAECVVLTSADGIAWSLLGPATTGLEVGTQLTVSGRSRPDAEGSCDAIPLSVTAVKTSGR